MEELALNVNWDVKFVSNLLEACDYDCIVDESIVRFCCKAFADWTASKFWNSQHEVCDYYLLVVPSGNLAYYLLIWWIVSLDSVVKLLLIELLWNLQFSTWSVWLLPSSWPLQKFGFLCTDLMNSIIRFYCDAVADWSTMKFCNSLPHPQGASMFLKSFRTWILQFILNYEENGYFLYNESLGLRCKYYD